MDRFFLDGKRYIGTRGDNKHPPLTHFVHMLHVTKNVSQYKGVPDRNDRTWNVWRQVCFQSGFR